jgi:hypothetical protein
MVKAGIDKKGMVKAGIDKMGKGDGLRVGKREGKRGKS